MAVLPPYNPWSAYFEAGPAPGLAYYVSFWYCANERSIRLALIYSTDTLGDAFGSVLAFGISHLNDAGDLEGWRWFFLLEGAPSILLGVFIFFYLPDYPESADFLTPEECELPILRKEFNVPKGVANNLKYLSFFVPSTVGGLGYDPLMARLMTVPTYTAAIFITIALSYLGDKSNKRALTTVSLMLVGSGRFIASATLSPHAYTVCYVCLIIASCGTFATILILLGRLSANLPSISAQGLVIALNVSIGAPDQITRVWIYKSSEKEDGLSNRALGKWRVVADGSRLGGGADCAAYGQE